jgi:segregation and condensation protein A
MQALETTIPWWRKALNFALDGIRSGFGLFSRSSKTEAVAEPTFSNNSEETQEKETTLIDPSPKPEIAAATPVIPAEPVTAAESTAAAEPVMEAAPEAVATAEAESEAVPEPIESAEPVFDAKPEPAAIPEAEAVNEPVQEAKPEPEPEALPESVESAEPVVEAEPEPAEVSEAEAVNEPDPEPIEALEPKFEPEPEIAEATEQAAEELVERVSKGRFVSGHDFSRAVSAAKSTGPLGPEECFSEVRVKSRSFSAASEAETATEALPESVESVEPIMEADPEPKPADIPEAEIVNEPDPEPVEAAEPVAEVKPEIAEATEAEDATEALPEPIESVEPVVEAEPEPAAISEPEIVNELVPEPVEALEPEAEAQPEPAEIPEAEIVNEPDPQPVEAAEPEAEAGLVDAAEPEAEPEIAEMTETEAATEALPEPVESVEPTVEADPEPEPVENSEDESMNEAIPEPVEAAEPEAEAGLVDAAEPEAEPEIAETTEAEDATEARPEPVESAEPVVEAEPEPAPEPVADAPVQLVLSTEPTADQKAAAKLAAQQKKRDESSEESPFSVVVGQVYDGPLDLLLDLIRKQDIDIYDIPIAKITAQFLAYVNQLKAGDVDVAGEFIYTASLLIHIKSRMLLPRAPSGPEDEAEDPRRELVEKLLEHERFKNAAQMLQQKQMLEAATWSNPGSREFKDDAAAEPEIAADTVDLVRVFSDILERARKRPILDVTEDSVTVSQMIQFLARRLTMEDKPIALRRLLSHTRSERALVAMFLALLELVRLQAILLRQDRAFSEIFIKKHTDFDTLMDNGLANAHDDWR